MGIERPRSMIWWRGLGALLCGLALGCAAAEGPTGSSPAARSSKVSDEVRSSLDSAGSVRVIVTLREPDTRAVSQGAREDQIAAIQEGVLAGLSSADFQLTHKWERVSAVAGEVTRGGLAKLEAHADVRLVGPDVTLRAFAAQSVPLIRAIEAHNLGFTGKGVTVAVIDTGIDSDHQDLFDAIVDQQCFCASCCPNGSSRQSGPGGAEDDQGHGTNVTGIINSAGRVAPVGVAPDTNIVAIKVLNREGSGQSSDIISSLDYVISQRSIKVVNMSLGGGRHSTVCDSADAFNQAAGQAIATLRSRGTATFVASGNEAFPDAVASPACVNAAVAVGAVYDDNVGGIRASNCTDGTTAADLPTCFSNSSTLVELMGPGAMITSSGLGGGTDTEGGTSQATPHVAGAAAVLFQVNPGASVSQVVDALKRTGRGVRDPKNGLTLPRIDLRAAIDAVR